MDKQKDRQWLVWFIIGLVAGIAIYSIVLLYWKMYFVGTE